MENYDFSKFSSTSFEALVCSLAYKALGLNGMNFGTGPDGGRDFIIDSKVAISSEVNWDGYTVIQAKCKESLEKGKKDIEWLKGELDKELAAYNDPDKKRKPPKNYIIATNVMLSGSDGKKATSGYSKILKHLEQWKTDLGVEEFDIWHSTKISRLLDAYPEIRQAYSCWVTPSDILSQVLKDYANKRSELETALKIYLSSNLKKDQFVRLRDAGDTDERKTRTGQVFIDIPGQYSIGEDHSRKFPLLRSIVQWSQLRLDPDSVDYEKENSYVSRAPKNVRRQIILGGPGQGKTTTGLFLIQLFRAVALSGSRIVKSDPDLKDSIEEIINRSSEEGIPTNLPSRFPVHIDLPSYADALTKAKSSQNPAPTILVHVADLISKSSGRAVTAEDVSHLLCSMSAVFVLDGLDEVPPSGERLALIQEIEKFDAYVTESNIDLLLIVTSRPQGYNQDLSSKKWLHWELTDLDKPAANRYLKGLAISQFPNNPTQQERILRELKLASQQPATAKLMLSPLQNCIMFLIVNMERSAPTDRWTLFQTYYDILQKREQAKEGPVGIVIEKNKKILESIHSRVGLILQIRSETSGEASAYFTHEDFKAFLYSFLSKTPQHQGTKLDERVNELFDIAMHRLVLLSTRQEERISFDVRSLQEFMAAKAIMSGPEHFVEKRLEHIADKAHWNHTFLIAAHSYFAESRFEHFRSNIVAIPRNLETDIKHKCIANGAQLARSMFNDGIGFDSDVHRRGLALHALECMEFVEENNLLAFETLKEPETDEIFRSSMRKFMKLNSGHSWLAAWSLAMSAYENMNDDSRSRLITKYSKLADSEKLKILNYGKVGLRSEFGIKELSELLLRSDVKDAYQINRPLVDHISRIFNQNNQSSQDKFKSLQFITVLGRDQKARSEIPFYDADGLPTEVKFRIRRLRSNFISDMDLSDEVCSAWPEVVLLTKFEKQPTKENLNSIFDSIKSLKQLERLKSFLGAMPWCLENLFHSCETTKELASIADKYNKGEFGQISDWEKAEIRWTENGVNLEDIIASMSSLNFLHTDISKKGIPSYYWTTGIPNKVPKWAFEILDCVHTAKFDPMYSSIQELASVRIAYLDNEVSMTKTQSKTLISFCEKVDLDKIHSGYEIFGLIPFIHREHWKDKKIRKSLLDLVDNLRKRPPLKSRPKFSRMIAGIYAKHKSEKRLLSLIALFARFTDLQKLHLEAIRRSNLKFNANDDDLKIAEKIILRLFVTKGETKDLQEIATKTNMLFSKPNHFKTLIERAISDRFAKYQTNKKIYNMRLEFLSYMLNNYSDLERSNLQKLKGLHLETLNRSKSEFMNKTAWFDKYGLPEDSFEFL